MRKVIRAEMRGGRERVAVVCGAYHAPALDPASFPPVSRDNALLSKLPRVKVAATWAPWTSGRLSYASGYGAGVRSPGLVPPPLRHARRGASCRRGSSGWPRAAR